MKKNYQMPMTDVVKVEFESMVASTKVSSVSNNAGLTGGTSGSNTSARTKENTYDVWDDDWSSQ